MNRTLRVLTRGIAALAVLGASTAAAVAGADRADRTIVTSAAPATTWQPFEQIGRAHV